MSNFKHAVSSGINDDRLALHQINMSIVDGEIRFMQRKSHNRRPIDIGLFLKYCTSQFKLQNLLKRHPCLIIDRL